MSLTDNPGILILSVFCAGGLFAYLRVTLRLSNLLAEGRRTEARIVQLEQEDAGESVKHYLVTYEFTHFDGKRRTHTRDIDNASFFGKLAVGETIPVLYSQDAAANSYPLEIVRADRKLNVMICFAIAAFWLIMALFFLLTPFA